MAAEFKDLTHIMPKAKQIWGAISCDQSGRQKQNIHQVKGPDNEITYLRGSVLSLWASMKHSC